MREGTKFDGKNPTILYGYGGFEQAMTPSYSGAIGSGWLEKGGVWVLANIRGGGEFGPEWHRTALREGRVKTHGTSSPVAEDVIKRGISSPQHLGIMGGSQGGLLVGAAFTQRPDLFKAVVCQVPLLDMKRYHKLLAGRLVDGRVRQSRRARRLGLHLPVLAVPERREGQEVPEGLLHDLDARRPRAPGPRAQDGRAHEEQGHDVVYFEYLEGATPRVRRRPRALTPGRSRTPSG
jgi:prolyl oligopeptidase